VAIARGIVVLTIALLSACATAPPDEELPSAESYYQRGVGLLEGRTVFFFFTDIDYPKAIESFQEVIDNYPYSEYAVLSELAIADIHGLCSYNQMRAADRDQAPTREAVAQFRALLERFPASEMNEDARARLAECEDRLAQQIIDIADFYYGEDDFHSAARRYDQVLTTYPGHATRARSMTRLGICLARLNQTERAEDALRRALMLEPDEDLRETAQAELDLLTAARQPLADPGADGS
jgi:outer membrane protein assembly factor BamD